MRKLCFFLVAVMVAFTSLGEAWAQSDYKPGAWRFSIVPYLWLPVQTTGTSTVDGTDADLDLSISDIIDSAETLFGLASRFETWYDRVGFVVEGSYFALETEEFSTVVPGPLPVSPGTTISAQVNLTQTWVNFLAAYHLGDWQVDDGATGAGSTPMVWWLQPMVGFRYGYIKQEIDVFVTPGAGGAPSFSRTLGGSEDYVEPVIAGRLGLKFAKEWTFLLYGDVGGFGAGSDLTWTFLTAFDWRPWKNTSIEFGYRVYSIDYQTGSGATAFGYDVFQHGPQIGVNFRF